MRRLFTLLLALALVLSAVPMALAEEPVVITAFVAGDPEIDYTQNYVIKKMEADIGVRLDVSNFVVTDENRDTQKQLLLSSGDYPDVFLCDLNFAEQVNYGTKEGIFIPLNKYLTDDIANYPTLNMLFTERPEYKSLLTAPDGNIYSLPPFSECGHCRATTKTYVNQEWLDKLGIAMPTTTAEFKEMLVKFRDGDPNGNGEKDEIPYSSNDGMLLSYLVNSFIPCDTSQSKTAAGKYTYVQDGVVKFAANDPAFKEAMAFARELFEEGLIDPAAFTQKDKQLSQIVSGEVPQVGVFTSGGIYSVDMNNPYVYSNYRIMMPLKGPAGVQVAPTRTTVQMNAMGAFGITDKCKNPDAAMKMIDYLANFDTYMVRVYGLEGEGWKLAEPGRKNVLGGDFKYEFLTAGVGGSADKITDNVVFYGGPWGALMQFRAQWSRELTEEEMYSDPKLFESRIETETVMLSEYFPVELPDRFFLPENETNEYSELYKNIKDYVDQCSALFVTGSLDLDAGWDNYVSDLSRYGVDRFVELLQKGHDIIYNK